LKKPNREKKPIKILKKPIGSVWFQFYKPETEKIKPNRKKPEKNRAKPKKPNQNRAKPEKNEPNRFEPVFVQKNRTKPKPVDLNRFQFFLSKKNSTWLLFLIKTEPNKK
jgi:hypothetical protein